jgi:hypothetical protein
MSLTSLLAADASAKRLISHYLLGEKPGPLPDRSIAEGRTPRANAFGGRSEAVNPTAGSGEDCEFVIIGV